MTRYKGSHDIENHCGYMINLTYAKSPFVKSILSAGLSQDKRLRFKSLTKPKSRLSVRPFVKSAIGVFFIMLKSAFLMHSHNENDLD